MYNSFDELVEAIEDGSYHELEPNALRLPETTDAYVRYKNSLTREELLEVLLLELAGFTTIWNGIPYAISRNRFPYDRLEFCDHYILWVDVKFDVATELVRSVLPDKVFVLLENVNSRKSIPELMHYHLFVKNK